MERWENKVAIITGASSGIGAAIAAALVKKGLLVVGLARGIEKVEELSKSLDGPGRLYAVKCDVTNENEVKDSFKWITEDIGPVHILVNNAGLTVPSSLIDGDTEDWRKVFEVNVLALCVCTREAVAIMKENNIDGHIIHINSVVGHTVLRLPVPNFNVYPASKYAVTALTESLRQELVYAQTKIKITSISPGNVKTNFQSGFPDDGTREALENMPCLYPPDIAEAVVYTLSTPPHVQVHEITIKPVADPF